MVVFMGYFLGGEQMNSLSVQEWQTVKILPGCNKTMHVQMIPGAQ